MSGSAGMASDMVLVFGLNANRALQEELFDLGLTAIVRESMQEVLWELRSGRFAGVIVDMGHADCDILEFVLNVRDIDPEIPVFIPGTERSSGEECAKVADMRAFKMRNLNAIKAEISALQAARGAEERLRETGE